MTTPPVPKLRVIGLDGATFDLLRPWVAAGHLRQLEDVLDGFENAPRALIRIFEGANLGKQLLRLSQAAAQGAA